MEWSRRTSGIRWPCGEHRDDGCSAGVNGPPAHAVPNFRREPFDSTYRPKLTRIACHHWRCSSEEVSVSGSKVVFTRTPPDPLRTRSVLRGRRSSGTRLPGAARCECTYPRSRTCAAIFGFHARHEHATLAQINCAPGGVPALVGCVPIPDISRSVPGVPDLANCGLHECFDRDLHGLSVAE